jgi:hypothetical protein
MATDNFAPCYAVGMEENPYKAPREHCAPVVAGYKRPTFVPSRRSSSIIEAVAVDASEWPRRKCPKSVVNDFAALRRFRNSGQGRPINLADRDR